MEEEDPEDFYRYESCSDDDYDYHDDGDSCDQIHGDSQEDLFKLDEDGNTDLHRACLEKNEPLAEDLITKYRDSGLNLDLKNGDKYTAMHLACQYGMLETISLLVGRGVDIHSRGPEGNTPLHLASMNGCLSIVTFLTPHWADINKVNDRGHNSLHVACISGHIEVVKWLMSQNGIQTRMESMEGNSLLHLACAHRNIGLVEYLVKEKEKDEGGMMIKWDEENEEGKTPLHLVCENADEDMADHLFTHYGLHNNYGIHNEWGKLLHWACRKSDKVLASFLLLEKFGMNIDVHIRGNSCLHLACREGELDMVEFLLDHHANPMGMNKDGLTPLHIACVSGQEEIVKLLLFRGVDVNILTGTVRQNAMTDYSTLISMRTPFHLSICNAGTKVVISILLEYGANINIPDVIGNTPLHSLLEKTDHDDTKALLQLNPDINARNNQGSTPLHLAAPLDNPLIYDLLARGPVCIGDNVLDTPFHVACRCGVERNVIRFLNFWGPDIIHLKNRAGDTPLHVAKYPVIARILLSNGAKANDQNNDGNTPLHLACSIGDYDMARTLVPYSPVPYIKNRYRQTPLELNDKLLELFYDDATNRNNFDGFQALLPRMTWMMIDVDTNFKLNFCPLPTRLPAAIQRKLSQRDRRAWFRVYETAIFYSLNSEIARIFASVDLVRFIADYLYPERGRC